MFVSRDGTIAESTTEELNVLISLISCIQRRLLNRLGPSRHFRAILRPQKFQRTLAGIVATEEGAGSNCEGSESTIELAQHILVGLREGEKGESQLHTIVQRKKARSGSQEGIPQTCNRAATRSLVE